MKKILVFIFVFAISAPIFAQKIVKVDAEYTYIAPDNITLEQAKLTALERAKIQAIADEFGTLVSQSNTTYIENKNENSRVNFQSFGGSEVKGEWIETTEDPIFRISYDQDLLIISVSVKGKIREYVAPRIDFSAKILCNGTDDRYERNDFKNGDDLYLSFISPTDGYLSIYLIDNNQEAFCLLPYQNQSSGNYRIQANKRYVFFSVEKADSQEKPMVDEYTMTTNQDREQNLVYVIFSPNEFTKATDYSMNIELPRQLKYEQFQKWLVKCRTHDKKMSVVQSFISIE